MYRTVMLPLDGSPLAELAAPLAARIAKRDGARLHLVTVHQLAPNPEAPGWTDADAAMAEAERDYLDRFAREMLDCYAVEASAALLRGLSVRHTLCGFVETANIDLVVMTTHGRTGLRRAVLGSVADGIVQESQVPVVLLRPLSRTGVGGSAPFRNLLIPLDGSPGAEQVMAPALAFVLPDAVQSVLLLRVVAPVTIPVHPYSYAATPTETDVEATERLAAEARAYLAAVAARVRQEHQGVEVGGLVLVNANAPKALLDAAASNHVDLVAMATSGRGLRRTLRGGFADAVLRDASWPVLLYRPHGD